MPDENSSPQDQGEGDGTTATLPPTSDPGPQRPRRRIDELARATDEPMVSGVSAGIARHFDVDPIIVRVAFVALTVVGLAGLVLYLGLWFLLPYDDGRKSVAAGWFGLDEKEPEFRTIGLVVTAVLAAAAVLGDTGWFWGGPAWALLLFLGLYWLVAVRPRRRRARAAAYPAADPAAATDPSVPTVARAPKAPRQPPLLFGLTACVAAITLGGLWLYGELADVSVGDGTYLATALIVVGVGVLVGAWWGRVGGLVFVGVLLCLALIPSEGLPAWSIGEQKYSPSTAGEVEPSYALGLGRLELDLTNLGEDAAELAGRRISVDSGIGETVVIVPDGLPVSVRADLTAGNIQVFGQNTEVRGPEDDPQGPDVVVTSEDPDALVLDIDQTFGQIKVVRS